MCVSLSDPWIFFCLIAIGTVELKKQISCSLQLTNKSDDYVAFKVFVPPVYLHLCTAKFETLESCELCSGFSLVKFESLIRTLSVVIGEDDEPEEVLCETKCWGYSAPIHM